MYIYIYIYMYIYIYVYIYIYMKVAQKSGKTPLRREFRLKLKKVRYGKSWQNFLLSTKKFSVFSICQA